MAVLYTNVSENAERVIDPISQQVIYSLARKLGVQEFFKNNTHYANDRSASSLYDTPEGDIQIASYNRMDIVVDTHFNPSDGQLFEGMSTGVNTPALWMGNHSKSNRRKIFDDPDIQFCVRELNMPFTLSFDITMRFREYDGAVLALSNILNRAREGMINEVHDIVYSYPFDTTSWSVISQIFRRRTTYTQAHPDDQVVDWLDSISKAQWGFDIRRPDLTETAVAKGDTEYAVTRQQLSCSAKLECSNGKPEPIMQEQVPVGYLLTCQYTIQFGRPHLLEFEIPPVVEQHEMPAAFFHTGYETDDPQQYGEASDPTMTQMMWQAANGKYTRAALIKIPQYDDWHTPQNSMVRQCKFLPVVEAVCVLDSVGGTTTIDLKDLGDAKISSWVLDILGTMDLSDITTYSGLFNVTIFVNDVPLDHKFINWDKENKVITFVGDKKESIYRLVFSEASVLDYIDTKWKDTLIQYRQYVPCALMRTMGYLSQVGILYILGDTSFRSFVSKCRMNGNLTTIVNAMIKQGCSVNIRQHIGNELDFTRYVCNTPWLNRAYTLYDLFVHTAKTLRYLSNNDAFGRTINIDGTYNYDFTVGGLPNGHNEPIRVFKTGFGKLKQ